MKLLGPSSSLWTAPRAPLPGPWAESWSLCGAEGTGRRASGSLGKQADSHGWGATPQQKCCLSFFEGKGTFESYRLVDDLEQTVNKDVEIFFQNWFSPEIFLWVLVQEILEMPVPTPVFWTTVRPKARKPNWDIYRFEMLRCVACVEVVQSCRKNEKHVRTHVNHNHSKKKYLTGLSEADLHLILFIGLIDHIFFGVWKGNPSISKSIELISYIISVTEPYE